MPTHTMKEYTIKMHSTRADGAVKGKLILVIQAQTEEEARQMVSDSLPGFDWEQWSSTWGLTDA